jgi:hypothetical protein
MAEGGFDSPHVDGIVILSVCVWLCVFFGKKLNLGETGSAMMILMVDLTAETYCTE